MTTGSYEVTIAGRLGPLMHNAFRNLPVRIEPRSTVITVRAADLDALWRTLNRLADRGLELYCLRFPRPEGSGPASEAADPNERKTMQSPTDGTDVMEMGPIDYMVVEFPGCRLKGEAWPQLVDLVDRGLIRIIDVLFMNKERDGSLRGMAIADFDGDARLDLAVFEGASSGLLTEEDMFEAGAALEPGNCAGLLVFENLWAAPFATALRRAGGQLVASGRVPAQAILAVLDAKAEGSPSR